MKFGVIRFPGSCDEVDALLACKRFAEGELLWHGDRDLRGADAIVIPGGFSYGDYLRAGAIARFSPVMEAVREFALDGGPVLGICNGFQVLCEAGLLPGALLPNTSLRFVCRQVELVVERLLLEPGEDVHPPAQERLAVLVGAEGGREGVVGRVVVVHREADLLQVVHAPGATSRATCSG